MLSLVSSVTRSQPARPMLRIATFTFLLGRFVCTSDAADPLLVDVVPPSQNQEHDQNSEPNIAVNPANPNQILITAFSTSNFKNPVYFSNDGGASWSLFQTTVVADQTLAWSPAGFVYLAILTPSGSQLAVARQTDPTAARHKFVFLPKSRYAPGGVPDQPWIEVASGATDRIYVAFNDLSRFPGATASIRFSLDSGLRWKNTVIESRRPGIGQDLPPVRVKAHGDIVYAAYQRGDAFNARGDVRADVMIVRDDQAGEGRFQALGKGGTAIVSNTLVAGRKLGKERIGSDLSVAIDPANPARVVVGFTVISGGRDPQAVLYLSTNSGATWTQVFAAILQSGLGAVAIAANGTTGFLYTTFDGVNLDTRLARFSPDFLTRNDTLLSRFPNGRPRPVFDPYIGDYQDLAAVGDTFYGVFSASNDVRQFPITPEFGRDATQLGTTVRFSIDPFFVKADAVVDPQPIAPNALAPQVIEQSIESAPAREPLPIRRGRAARALSGS